jgi:hypothetical protein
VVQIVTLTGTFTDTAEDRVTTVGLGDVVDELSNEDSLSDTSTTEKTNLTTLSVGGKQVDDLDTSFQDFGDSGLVNELRGVGVDGAGVLSVDGTSLVDGLTNDVDDTTKALGTDRDSDGGTSVSDTLTTNKTLSTVHGNGTDSVLTQVLGDFEDKTDVVTLDLEGVQDRGQVTRLELDVDDGTDNGTDLTEGKGFSSQTTAGCLTIFM